MKEATDVSTTGFQQPVTWSFPQSKPSGTFEYSFTSGDTLDAEPQPSNDCKDVPEPKDEWANWDLKLGTNLNFHLDTRPDSDRVR